MRSVSNVNDFKVGDKVIALVGWGGMAEKVVTKAFKCLPMPPDMPYDEAGSIHLYLRHVILLAQTTCRLTSR